MRTGFPDIIAGRRSVRQEELVKTQYSQPGTQSIIVTNEKEACKADHRLIKSVELTAHVVAKKRVK